MDTRHARNGYLNDTMENGFSMYCNVCVLAVLVGIRMFRWEARRAGDTYTCVMCGWV